MKSTRFYALVILCFSCFVATGHARNQTTFVSDNKIWYGEKEYYAGQDVSPWTFYMKGDTVIDSKTYKMAYGDIESYFREEGKRIYRRLLDGEEFLMYDFNLEKNDVLVDACSDNPDFKMQVLYKRIIEREGRNLICLGFGFYDAENENKSFDESSPEVLDIWIEGVGNISHPEYAFYSAAGNVGTSQVKCCMIQDECIYKRRDHDFLTKSTAWLEGHGNYLNYHYVSGDTTINHRHYHNMQVINYVIKEDRVELEKSVDYWLSEEDNGDVYLYSENMASLMAIINGNSYNNFELLNNKALFLFNAKKRAFNRMNYGKVFMNDKGEYDWEIKQGIVWEISTEYPLLDGTKTSHFIFKNNNPSPMVRGIGWEDYGPFMGLTENETDVSNRFFIFLQDGEVLYEETENHHFNLQSIPDLLQIITHVNICKYTGQFSNSDVVYDLSGRQLQKKPTKGLYIQNGKLMLSK